MSLFFNFTKNTENCEYKETYYNFRKWCEKYMRYLPSKDYIKWFYNYCNKNNLKEIFDKFVETLLKQIKYLEYVFNKLKNRCIDQVFVEYEVLQVLSSYKSIWSFIKRFRKEPYTPPLSFIKVKFFNLNRLLRLDSKHFY